MTGDGSPVFIDTNILVYANISESPQHQSALGTLLGYAHSGVELWISRQVLREYMATVTRPQAFAHPRPLPVVVERVQYFETHVAIAEDSTRVTRLLLDLLEQVPVGGRQIHDANIVATMLACGIPRLLTANPGDFARFVPRITVIPL